VEPKFRKLEMSELGRLSPDELHEEQNLDFVFVLDSVRSLNNVGSIFRTSDAFRAARISLCGLTGQPPHRDIQKTALGATETVCWTHFSEIKDCLTQLRNQAFTIIGIEQTSGSISLEKFRFTHGSKYAFVLGNEVSGVSDEALSLCDMVIEIPQFGSKHSLNVAVTAGIVGWEYVSQSLKAH